MYHMVSGNIYAYTRIQLHAYIHAESEWQVHLNCDVQV